MCGILPMLGKLVLFSPSKYYGILYVFLSLLVLIQVRFSHALKITLEFHTYEELLLAYFPYLF
jgi:hypothetical protein